MAVPNFNGTSGQVPDFNAPPPEAPHDEGFDWNPIHDVGRAIHNTYNYVNPVGGLKQIAGGVGGFVWKPLGNAMHAVADEITAPWTGQAKANAHWAGTVQGLGDDLTGLVPMVENWMANPAHLVPGFSGFYDKGAQGLNLLLSMGGDKAGVLSDEQIKNLAGPVDADGYVRGAKPQDVLQLASKGGLASAVAQNLPAVSEAAGAISAVTDTASMGAYAQAADAATAGDVGAAEGLIDKANRLQKVSDISEKVSHPIATPFKAVADYMKANQELQFPWEAPKVVEDPATGETAVEPAAQTEATPEEVAQAVGDLDPQVAAADAMATSHAQSVADAEREAIGKVPNNEKIQGPEATAEADQSLAADEQAAKEAQPQTAGEQRQGARLAMPTPEWANRLAARTPEALSRFIGSHGMGIVDKVRWHDLVRSLQQLGERQQNSVRQGTLMRAGTAAAKEIWGGDQSLKQEDVGNAVAEEIIKTVNGEQFAQNFAHRELTEAPPEVLAKMTEAAGRRYKGITDEMRANLTDEQNTRLNELVQKGVEAYKSENAQMLQTLLGTRFGSRGLESGLLNPDEVQMTQADMRLYRRVMSDLRRSKVWESKLPNLVERAYQQMMQSAFHGNRLADYIVKLQKEHGINAQNIVSLHDGVPPGIKDAAAQDATIHTLLSDAANHEQLGEGFHSTVDPAYGRVVNTQVGYTVHTAPQFDVAASDFTPETVREALMRPQIPNGRGTYDAVRLWGGLDANLSIEGYQDAQGVSRIRGTISQATINGTPLNYMQARVIGEAFESPTIFNHDTGSHVDLSNNRMLQTMHAHYLPQILDPKSGINRRWAQGQAIAESLPNTGLTDERLFAETQARQMMDYSYFTRNKLHKIGDLFKTDVKIGKGLPVTKTYLAQSPLDLTSSEGIDAALRDVPVPKTVRIFRGSDAPEAPGSAAQGSWWTIMEPQGRQGYAHWQVAEVPADSVVRLLNSVQDDAAREGVGSTPRLGKDLFLDPSNPAMSRWMENAKPHEPIDNPMQPQVHDAATQLSARLGRTITDQQAEALFTKFTQQAGAEEAAGRILSHRDGAMAALDVFDRAARTGMPYDPAEFHLLDDWRAEETGTVDPPPPDGPYTTLKFRVTKSLDEGTTEGIAQARKLVDDYVSKRLGDMRDGVEPIDTSPEELHQQFNGKVRGVTLIDGDPTTRLTARLYGGADFGTLLHEDMHLLRLMAPGDEVATLQDYYPHIQDPLTKDGKLTAARRFEEELFVRDYIGYLHSKTHGLGAELPTNIPTELFGSLAESMNEQLPAWMESGAGVATPNDIIDYWDGVFNPEIVKPSVYTDPLSAQYTPPPPGVNTVQHRWESDSQFAERTRQYGEARQRQETIDVRTQALVKQQAKVDAATTKMLAIWEQGGEQGIKVQKLADKLKANAGRNIAKLDERLGNPSMQNVPPQWRGPVRAFQEMADVIREDPNAGEMAGILAEIPDTFAKVVQVAAERGFDPTYVPEMTWEKAERYLYGHLKLNADPEMATTRKINRGVVVAKDVQSRSLEALGAAQIIATKEMLQSKLIDFIEKYHAKPIPESGIMPGWESWDAARSGIIEATDRTGKRIAVNGGNDTMMIPKNIGDAIRELNNKPHAGWAARFGMKGGPTTIWKDVLLTYSPSWYIKHFMGTVTTAVLAGAKWGDFRTAVRQAWEKDEFGLRGAELPDVAKGGSIWRATEEAGQFGHTPGDFMQRNVVEGARRAEGLRDQYNNVRDHARNVVKTVDSMGRAAVYAAKLREGMNPELAADAAYKALGDFGDLSPIERGMVSTIIPFYAFQKAMFKILIRMPVDHPLATAIFAQTGQMQQQQLEEALGGSIPDMLTGSFIDRGKLVSAPKSNPLTDAYKIITPEGIVSSLHPFVKLLIEQGGGADAFNNKPGMNVFGGLSSQPNVGAELGSAFLSGPLGAATGQKEWQRAIFPEKVYSDTEWNALIKRLQKTRKSIELGRNGGYLVVDVNAAKNPNKKQGSVPNFNAP